MTAFTHHHRNGVARFDTLEPYQVIRLRQWPVHRPSRRVGHFAIWAHVAYFILVILAVLIVTVVLGYWSPAS